VKGRSGAATDDKPIVEPPSTPGSILRCRSHDAAESRRSPRTAVFFWYHAKSGRRRKFILSRLQGWGIAFTAVGARLTIGGAVLWHQASTGALSAAIGALAYTSAGSRSFIRQQLFELSGVLAPRAGFDCAAGFARS